MRMRCSVRLLAVSALLAALTAAGCARPPSDAPPADLRVLPAAVIERSRVQKDQLFRTSADSPIPAERRSAFRGLEYYPVSPDWQVRALLHRFPGGVPFVFTETGGTQREAQKVGYFEFTREGKTWRLHAYRFADTPPQRADELFVPFQDATSGVETYGAGRYLDLAPGLGGWYVLDFNLAYHPYCAYSDAWSCPRTPAENRLSLAVRAGERGQVVH